VGLHSGGLVKDQLGRCLRTYETGDTGLSSARPGNAHPNRLLETFLMGQHFANLRRRDNCCYLLRYREKLLMQLQCLQARAQWKAGHKGLTNRPFSTRMAGLRLKQAYFHGPLSDSATTNSLLGGDLETKCPRGGDQHGQP
jgi:hypothetical protein